VTNENAPVIKKRKAAEAARAAGAAKPATTDKPAGDKTDEEKKTGV
jgi:hypothetical protein